MGFVHERTDSGLLVARQAGEGASVAQALRDHDRNLRLVPQYSQQFGQYWAVYRYRGSEQEADLVCVWCDPVTREPYPLSHGLVEKVKSKDRNGRGDDITADEANRRHAEETKRDSDRRLQDLVDDWVPRKGRSTVLHRGAHLRRARSKTGYHDMKRGRDA